LTIFGILCSLVGTQIQLEYGPAVTARIAVGSALGFYLGQTANRIIFDKFRHSRTWQIPPAVSNTFGSVLDTLIFFSIAFSSATLSLFSALGLPDENEWAFEVVPVLLFDGEAPLWVSLALADFGIKLVMAAIMIYGYRRLVTYFWGAGKMDSRWATST